ncbi:MAG: hypothetical protein KGV44_05370 [Flavobacteriaceae bacterium]|nr:hypothetical protein [Flavobacteriaceae bacterium]
MKKIKLIIFFCSLLSLQSCFEKKSNKQKVDSFYIRLAGWDYQRIPLIKPLELIKLKGENDWGINTSALQLKTIDGGDFSPIDLIFCTQDTILGHKPFYQDPELKKFKTLEYWFYINVKKKKITKYDNEHTFLKEHPKYGYKLKHPDYYFSIFEKKIILPWFNDSIKTQIINNKS